MPGDKANTLNPIVRCEATSKRTGDRCALAVTPGQKFCAAHLRMMNRPDSTSTVTPFELPPDLTDESTPDDVLTRWMHSRRADVRFYAAKRALDRELSRMQSAPPSFTDLRPLSDEAFDACIADMRAYVANLEAGSVQPTAQATPSKAYRVLTSLKTAADHRLAIQASLELEAYDEAVHKLRPKPQAIDVARARAILERIERLRTMPPVPIAESTPSAITEEIFANNDKQFEDASRPAPEPEDEPASDGPQLIDVESERLPDGSIEERRYYDNGTIKFRIRIDREHDNRRNHIAAMRGVTNNLGE